MTGCNKVGFDSRRDALKYADEVIYLNRQHKKNKERSRGKKKLKAYSCRFCGKWHLSSKSQHGRKEKARVRKNNGNI